MRLRFHRYAPLMGTRNSQIGGGRSLNGRLDDPELKRSFSHPAINVATLRWA